MTVLTTTRRPVGGIADYPAPKLVFIPNFVFQSLELKNEPINTVLNLDQMIKVLGVNETANLIFLNSLYDAQDSFFKQNELIKGFETFDLIDKYRDDLKAYPELEMQYDNMIAKTEGLKLTKGKLPDNYIYDMEVTASKKAEYYVPEMFLLNERVYGVRLKAITGDEGVDNKKALKDATVANVCLLSNSYDIRQIAGFELFKSYIALC